MRKRDDKEVPIAAVITLAVSREKKANCGCVFVQLRIGKRNAPQSHVAVEKSGKYAAKRVDL